MRTLTIHRRKAATSCLVKAKIYIEDNEKGDTIIFCCKCRKLGEVKNNSQLVVDIDNEGRRIFAVMDLIYKDIANTIYIPAGEDDVTIFGGCHLAPLMGNPFVFERNIQYSKPTGERKQTPQSQEPKKKRRKKDPYNGKIRPEYIQYTTLTIALVSFVGFVCGIFFLLEAIFYGNMEMDARIFMYVLSVFALLFGCVYAFLAPILIRRYPKYKKITCALLQEYLFKECTDDEKNKKFKNWK